MLTAAIRSYKRILRNFRSGRILNKIGSGNRVFFESTLNKTAFKYLPGEIGKLSKYYIKHYSPDEHEIDSNSKSILRAVLEGKPISEARYQHYHSEKDVVWNLEVFNTSVTNEIIFT